jgi:hypothetical protein
MQRKGKDEKTSVESARRVLSVHHAISAYIPPPIGLESQAGGHRRAAAPAHCAGHLQSAMLP